MSTSRLPHQHLKAKICYVFLFSFLVCLFFILVRITPRPRTLLRLEEDHKKPPFLPISSAAPSISYGDGDFSSISTHNQDTSKGEDSSDLFCPVPPPKWHFDERLDFFSPPINLPTDFDHPFTAWETDSHINLLNSVTQSMRETKTLNVLIYGGSVTWGYACRSIKRLCVPTPSAECFGEEFSKVDKFHWRGKVVGRGEFCSWPSYLQSYLSWRLPKIKVKMHNICQRATSISGALQSYYDDFLGGRSLDTNQSYDIFIVDSSVNDCLHLEKFFENDETGLLKAHERFIRNILDDSKERLQRPLHLLYFVGGGYRYYPPGVSRPQQESDCLSSLGRITDYYNIPTVWYNEVWDHYSRPFWNHSLFSFISDDNHHPSWIGQEWIAQNLMSWFDWLFCSSEKVPALIPPQDYDIPPLKWIEASELFFRAFITFHEPRSDWPHARRCPRIHTIGWDYIYEGAEKDKPGWISNQPGKCIRFPFRTASVGAVEIGYLRSYENAGICAVRISPDNISFELDSLWTSKTSQVDKTFVKDLIPDSEHFIDFEILPLDSDQLKVRLQPKFKLVSLALY